MALTLQGRTADCDTHVTLVHLVQKHEHSLNCFWRTLLLPRMAVWSIPESIQASYETSRSLRSWGSIFCTPRIGLRFGVSGLVRGWSDVRGGRRWCIAC